MCMCMCVCMYDKLCLELCRIYTLTCTIRLKQMYVLNPVAMTFHTYDVIITSLQRLVGSTKASVEPVAVQVVCSRLSRDYQTRANPNVLN